MVLGSRRFGSWWLDRRLRSKGLAVLAPPVLVLVITVAASFIVERYQVAFRESGSAANRMAFQSAQVLSELLNAETGMRGYAATSNTFFLPPYNAAIATLPTDLNTLVRIAPTPAAALNATNVKALATESHDGLLPQLAAIEQGVRNHTLTEISTRRSRARTSR